MHMESCELLYSRNYLKGTHVFIHFNLCIALLLGNIVFVSGVDTATSNRVCYSHNFTTC